MKLALCRCKATKPEDIYIYFEGFATKQMREDNFKTASMPILGNYYCKPICL